MNRIYKFIVIFTLTLSVGCDPTRIDSPPLFSTEAEYFEDVEEFRLTVAAAYAKLQSSYHFNANFTRDWALSLWYLPGDDLTETQGSRTAEELFDGTMSPTNGRIGYVFDHTYEMVAKSNVVIEKVNTIDYSDYEGAEEVPMIQGEAYFLRAYAYFLLSNVYGGVPLVLERITTEEKTNTPRAEFEEVLDQVISDCETALPLLPESWADEFRGRATKNSARALLIKALVFRGNYFGNTADFSEALTVFNGITGAELRSRFLDNFDAALEHNSESMFEIQSSIGGFINNTGLYNGGPWWGVENAGIYRGMMTTAGSGYSADQASTRFIVTDKLFNSFGTDPRISYFLRADDNEGGRLFQKYTLPELDVLHGPHATSVNNERILRYGGIKLLAAEAALKSGDPAGAIGHLNDVRTRARDWGLSSGEGDGISPTDYSTAETDVSTIMQWIMDERYVELAGEGQRWWDLKRWHANGDIDLSGWDGGDQFFSTNLASQSSFNIDKHLVFPLPQAEVERNSSIINNNPGY